MVFVFCKEGTGWEAVKGLEMNQKERLNVFFGVHCLHQVTEIAVLPPCHCCSQADELGTCLGTPVWRRHHQQRIEVVMGLSCMGERNERKMLLVNSYIKGLE